MPTNPVRADECLVAPNSPAPEGSHWYFRTDRAKQRKCWYLRTLDQLTPHSAASATSGAAPGAPPSAFEKQAAASVDAPLSISPVSSSQSAQKESSPPAISEPPAPRSSASSQTRAQAAGPTPRAGVSTNNAAANDDCLTAPNSRAPEGSHWYYHTDRAKQRKCWHLRLLDQSTQHNAAQATQDAEPATRTSSFEKPATASAGAPSAMGSHKSAEPLPSPTTPPSNAPRDELAGQSVQQETAARSISENSTQANVPSQTSAPSVGPTAAAATVQLDRPVVASVEARKSNSISNGARADSLRQPVHTQVPDNAERTASGGASTTNTAGMAVKVAWWEIFLIIALGLFVAGGLYRVAAKMAAVRRRRTITDKYHSERADDYPTAHWMEDRAQHRPKEDRDQHESPQGRQQHGSVGESEEFIEDLLRSLVRPSSDHSVRQAIRANDEWQNDANGARGSHQLTDELREDTLMRLRGELDQLLSAKRA